MSRYVDIEPKIAEIKRIIEIQKHRKEEYEKNEFWDWSKGIQSAKRAIDECENELALLEEIPTADVRENVHGEWMKPDSDRNCPCSKCGHKWAIEIIVNRKMNFCPYCGADMRSVTATSDTKRWDGDYYLEDC